MTREESYSLSQYLQFNSYKIKATGVRVDPDAFVHFLDNYKAGEIVYPQAVSKAFGVSRAYAVSLLEQCCSYGVIRKQYEVICAYGCQRPSGVVVDSAKDLPEEVFCHNCDRKIIHPEQHMVPIYKVV